jgi:hypothetical protein
VNADFLVVRRIRGWVGRNVAASLPAHAMGLAGRKERGRFWSQGWEKTLPSGADEQGALATPVEKIHSVPQAARIRT